MRVLVDTDVILDYLLARPEFITEATDIWNFNQQGTFTGYISAITPPNIFYIARKLKGADIARELVKNLTARWRVAAVDEAILKLAVQLPMNDFEDAIQHACASQVNADCIVTRNAEDYRHATIPVYSPTEFLHWLKGKA